MRRIAFRTRRLNPFVSRLFPQVIIGKKYWAAFQFQHRPLIGGEGISRLAGEKHYDAAKSQDKDFIVIEGAAHTGPECVPCESFPRQYANSLTNQMNYMRDWVNQPGRF